MTSLFLSLLLGSHFSGANVVHHVMENVAANVATKVIRLKVTSRSTPVAEKSWRLMSGTFSMRTLSVGLFLVTIVSRFNGIG